MGSIYKIDMDIPEFVRGLIARLQREGFDAYIVGGAVRDICMDRPVTDWDIASSAKPEDIKEIFHDIRHFTLKHETVTLVHAKKLYEITTMRHRCKSKGIIYDLKHRDFTINAMAYDISENVLIDPARGTDDIKRKKIRATCDTKARFREDPLRMLRAIRLACEFDFSIEDHTMNAIINLSDLINRVANERIRDELIKILTSNRPSFGLNLLRKTGILHHIIPELLEGYLKRQGGYHQYTIFRHILETVDRVEPDLILRLAALFHDIAKPRARQKIEGRFRFNGHAQMSALLATEIMTRLRFSKDIISRVNNLIKEHMIDYNDQWSDGAIRRLVRRVGPENIKDLILIRIADILAHGHDDVEAVRIRELDRRIKNLMIKNQIENRTGLAVEGKRVMEVMELPEGPEIGVVLNYLLEKVTDDPELNSEDTLIGIMKDLKKEKPY